MWCAYDAGGGAPWNVVRIEVVRIEEVRIEEVVERLRIGVLGVLGLLRTRVVGDDAKAKGVRG